jgi:hypothetical protein
VTAGRLGKAVLPQKRAEFACLGSRDWSVVDSSNLQCKSAELLCHSTCLTQRIAQIVQRTLQRGADCKL